MEKISIQYKVKKEDNTEACMIAIVPYNSKFLQTLELYPATPYRDDAITQRYDMWINMVEEWAKENGFKRRIMLNNLEKCIDVSFNELEMQWKSVIYLDGAPVMIYTDDIWMDNEHVKWIDYIEEQRTSEWYCGYEIKKYCLGYEQHAELFEIFDTERPYIWPYTETDQAAGINLYMNSNVRLDVGEQIVIGANVKIKQYPDGTYAQIFPRFRCAYQNMDVFPGVIDRDYEGEIHIVIRNSGKAVINLCSGQSYVQLVFVKYEQQNGSKIKRGKKALLEQSTF